MAYLEHDPRPDLTDVVACTWQRTASAAGRHRVVPDGCVDLVWRGGALTVAGPDTAAWMSPLEQAVAARRAGMDEPDRLVLAPTRALGRPRSRVRAVGGRLGLSDRQLLRRFRTAVGYGPKTLDRVLRFQRFLARG